MLGGGAFAAYTVTATQGLEVRVFMLTSVLRSAASHAVHSWGNPFGKGACLEPRCRIASMSEPSPVLFTYPAYKAKDGSPSTHHASD